MIIAIPVSENNGLDSALDPRFGRAAGFMLYNVETKEFEYVSNTQNYEAAQGAGIQTAQNLLNQKANAVISGLCGPKAFAVLSKAGIELFYRKGGTVKEALGEYEAGKLKLAKDANIEGHWV